MAQIWTPGGGSSGLSLELPGATQPTRYVGATAGGAPVSGTFQQGDFIIDNTGNVYICTVAGSPGTWGTIAGGVTAVLAGTNCQITGTAQQPIVNFAQLDPLIPTGVIGENYPRFPGVSSATQGPNTSGIITFYAVTLTAGQIISKINVYSGSTAGATLTHTWFGLYDVNLNALAATQDDTSAAWAVNTLKSLQIFWKYSAGWTGGSATTYTIPTSGIYYIGLMTAGTTMPTYIGTATNATLSTVAPAISGTDNHAGQTTPQTSPAQLISSGGGGGMPYIQYG